MNIVASTKENVRDYVLTVSFPSEKTDISEPVLVRTLKIHVWSNTSSPCHCLLTIIIVQDT